MARTRAARDLLSETAPPDPTPKAAVKPAAVKAPLAAVEGEAEAEPTVRSTLDLPVPQHNAIQQFTLEAGTELGWRLRPQHVLRRLAERLLKDPQLRDDIMADLRKAGPPVRRRSSQ